MPTQSITTRAKNLKCGNGNKPCGGRCIPNNWTCHDDTEERDSQQNNSKQKQYISSRGTHDNKSQLTPEAQYVQNEYSGENFFEAIQNFVADFRQGSTINPNAYYPPENSLPDEVTIMEYDKLQPGDVIARTSLVAPGLGFQHFGVYAGVNKKTGEHMVVEDSHVDPATRRFRGHHKIALNSMELPAEKNVSDWYKVSSPQTTREEAVQRAIALVGRTNDYHLAYSNCEHIARAIADNKPRTFQAALKGSWMATLLNRLQINANKTIQGKDVNILLYNANKEIKSGKLDRKIKRIGANLFTRSGANPYENFAEEQPLRLASLGEIIDDLGSTTLLDSGEMGKTIYSQILQYYLAIASTKAQ